RVAHIETAAKSAAATTTSAATSRSDRVALELPLARGRSFGRTTAATASAATTPALRGGLRLLHHRKRGVRVAPCLFHARVHWPDARRGRQNERALELPGVFLLELSEAARIDLHRSAGRRSESAAGPRLRHRLDDERHRTSRHERELLVLPAESRGC